MNNCVNLNSQTLFAPTRKKSMDATHCSFHRTMIALTIRKAFLETSKKEDSIFGRISVYAFEILSSTG